MLFLSDEVTNIGERNHSDFSFSFNEDKFPHISTFGDQILESERITVSHGRVGVGDILGDCGSPDPGSIPGPGPISELQC